jgi:acyl-CoA thioester hydrolase
VRSLNIEYHRSAHIDDLLMIATEIELAKGPKMQLAQKMQRDGELITEARVMAVAIKSNGRPTRLPQSIQQIFEK